MESLFTITGNNSIELDLRDQKSLRQKKLRLSQQDEDPRADIFSELGIQTDCMTTLKQRGLLLMNDGRDASLDIWQRFSLAGNKPIEVISLQEGVTNMLRLTSVQTCLQQADVIVVPGSAAPLVLQEVLQQCPSVISSKADIVTVTPCRTWKSDRSSTVVLNEQDQVALRSAVSANSNVVILDDVASTYQTADIIANQLEQASIVSLTTVLSTVPKPERYNMLRNSKLTKAYAGIVTQYSGGHSWQTPAIATTASIFKDTKKSIASLNNIKRFLKADGIALDILKQRIDQEIRLLLLDLDGTMIDGNEPNKALLDLLTVKQNQFFSVAATGRSVESFQSIATTKLQNIFRAGVVSNGALALVGEQQEDALRKAVDPKEVEKVIEKTTKKTNVASLVTNRSALGKKLPWWVRIRANESSINEPDNFDDTDTEAAIKFADAVNSVGRFEAQASGNGDVLLAWPGMDKSTTGISALSRLIPTLPTLRTAIAAGDGLNDIGLLSRIKQAGGDSFAVNPVAKEVIQAASIQTTRQNLANAINNIL